MAATGCGSRPRPGDLLEEESQTFEMSENGLLVDDIDDVQFELPVEANLPSSPTLKLIREEKERQKKSVKSSQDSKAPESKMITRPKSNGNDIQFAPLPTIPALRKGQKSSARSQFDMRFAPIKTQVDAGLDGLPNETRPWSHTPNTR